MSLVVVDSPPFPSMLPPRFQREGRGFKLPSDTDEGEFPPLCLLFFPVCVIEILSSSVALCWPRTTPDLFYQFTNSGELLLQKTQHI